MSAWVLLIQDLQDLSEKSLDLHLKTAGVVFQCKDKLHSILDIPDSPLETEYGDAGVMDRDTRQQI